MIRFDVLHNSHLELQGTQELFELSSAFENSVVPQEYGTDRGDKRRIGSKMCKALLEKIKYDLTITMVTVSSPPVIALLVIICSLSVLASHHISLFHPPPSLSPSPPPLPPSLSSGRALKRSGLPPRPQPRRGHRHQLSWPLRAHPLVLHLREPPAHAAERHALPQVRPRCLPVRLLSMRLLHVPPRASTQRATSFTTVFVLFKMLFLCGFAAA